MKNLFFIAALAIGMNTLSGQLHAQAVQTHRQSFYVNPTSLDGKWELIKTEERRDGKLFKIYQRKDLREGIEKERIVVMAAPTKSDKVSMRYLMSNALFPVKFAPGTKTKVYRETESEAIMEWWSADQYHSFVRIMTAPGEYHSVTYLYKGNHKPTAQEREQWVSYLDSIQLNY